LPQARSGNWNHWALKFGCPRASRTYPKGASKRPAGVIEAANIVWAARCRREQPHATARRGNSIAPAESKSLPDLSIPGHPEAFAIGDIAAVLKDGKQIPGVSPASDPDGRNTSPKIIRDDIESPLPIDPPPGV